MTEKNLSKLMGQAINDYDMIKEGDRIVVGLSGGIDSLALLILLHGRLKRIPIKYELFPVFVDNFNGENEDYNKKVGKFLNFIKEKTKLETHLIPVRTINVLTKGSKRKRDACFLCSQKRRTELIKYASLINCNRIALGHHMDDIVETSLMNLFYKRELSSMLPRLDLFNGKISIIRPLSYIKKIQIESFIYNLKEIPPVFGEVCPSKIMRRDLRREKIREIIQMLLKDIPNLKRNIFASFRNPQVDYLLNHFFNPKKAGKFKRP